MPSFGYLTSRSFPNSGRKFLRWWWGHSVTGCPVLWSGLSVSVRITRVRVRPTVRGRAFRNGRVKFRGRLRLTRRVSPGKTW